MFEKKYNIVFSLKGGILLIIIYLNHISYVLGENTIEQK